LLENTYDNSLGYSTFRGRFAVGTGIAKEYFRNPFDSVRESPKIRRLFPDTKIKNKRIKHQVL
jgi:hypothetical protein